MMEHLREQVVQVDVWCALNVQITAANFIQGLTVHHQGDVPVLKQGIRAQDGVVSLKNRRRDLRCRDHELAAAQPNPINLQPTHTEVVYCHGDDCDGNGNGFSWRSRGYDQAD